MKWIDNLITKTKTYQKLERDWSFIHNQLEKLRTMYDEQYKHLLNNVQQVEKNKKIARKIVRLTNSLLKKDELVQTKKAIQALCHEIIKGEKE